MRPLKYAQRLGDCLRKVTGGKQEANLCLFVANQILHFGAWSGSHQTIERLLMPPESAEGEGQGTENPASGRYGLAFARQRGRLL